MLVEVRELMASIRFKVAIRDVPPAVAARTLGLTLEAFTAKLSDLCARGFPPPDPTTGNFDLKAIECWQDARYPQLLGSDRAQITTVPSSVSLPIRERLKALAK